MNRKMTAFMLAFAILLAAPAGLAQDDGQGPAQKTQTVRATDLGPMSDWDSLELKPGKIGGPDATGVFYRERSSEIYLERFDVVNNKMTGWTINTVTDGGYDTFGRLADDFSYFRWSTMGYSRWSGIGEVSYYTKGYTYSSYDYVNGWGITGSGTMAPPTGCYSGSNYESFFDGTADNWNDDGSGTWSVRYVNDPGNYIDNRIYDSTGIGSSGWKTSNYNYGYSTSYGFVYCADARRIGNLYNSYGISFCSSATPMNNMYGFYISDNNYSVWEYNSGSPTAVIGWTTSTKIDNSDGAWNHLKVVADSGTFDLYINSSYVNTFTDTTHSSGYVGVAGYDSTGYETIQWDNPTCHRNASKKGRLGAGSRPGAEVDGDDTGVFK